VPPGVPVDSQLAETVQADSSSTGTGQLAVPVRARQATFNNQLVG
jgi:hypothetical protein